jgi:hypothetical protein
MEENKYQRGKIYKIVDNAYNMCYYGSTINMLCQRMSLHREQYKKNILKCLTKKIFDEYGLENCKIELVENYPCNSRNELEAREGHYIKNNILRDTGKSFESIIANANYESKNFATR